MRSGELLDETVSDSLLDSFPDKPDQRVEIESPDAFNANENTADFEDSSYPASISLQCVKREKQWGEFPLNSKIVMGHTCDGLPFQIAIDIDEKSVNRTSTAKAAYEFIEEMKPLFDKYAELLSFSHDAKAVIEEFNKELYELMRERDLPSFSLAYGVTYKSKDGVLKYAGYSIGTPQLVLTRTHCQPRNLLENPNERERFVSTYEEQPTSFFDIVVNQQDILSCYPHRWKNQSEASRPTLNQTLSSINSVIKPSSPVKLVDSRGDITIPTEFEQEDYQIRVYYREYNKLNDLRKKVTSPELNTKCENLLKHFDDMESNNTIDYPKASRSLAAVHQAISSPTKKNKEALNQRAEDAREGTKVWRNVGIAMMAIGAFIAAAGLVLKYSGAVATFINPLIGGTAMAAGVFMASSGTLVMATGYGLFRHNRATGLSKHLFDAEDVINQNNCKLKA